MYFSGMDVYKVLRNSSLRDYWVLSILKKFSYIETNVMFLAEEAVEIKLWQIVSAEKWET